MNGSEWVRATRGFISQTAGARKRDEKFLCPTPTAIQLENMGLVIRLEKQSKATSAGKSSQSLPVAQVSGEATLSELCEPVVSSSQSTPPSAPALKRTSSMRATRTGGTATTKKSAPPAKKQSSGRRVFKRPNSST